MGMVFSFMAGLAALRWLSRWLEQGCWSYFGVYWLALAAVVFVASYAFDRVVGARPHYRRSASMLLDSDD